MNVALPWNLACSGVFGGPWCQATRGMFCEPDVVVVPEPVPDISSAGPWRGLGGVRRERDQARIDAIHRQDMRDIFDILLILSALDD